jgi:hypothetical protein
MVELTLKGNRLGVQRAEVVLRSADSRNNKDSNMGRGRRRARYAGTRRCCARQVQTKSRTANVGAGFKRLQKKSIPAHRLAAFAATRLAAAFFATFVDLMDVLLAIAFTRRCLRYTTVSAVAEF